MARICILTSGHPPFDTRVFVKEARALAAAGHEVTLVVPHQGSEERDGVRITPVAIPKGRWDRWLLTPWRVWAAGRRTGADVFHLHDPELMPVAVCLRLVGAKVIYDIHEDLPKDLMAKSYIPRWGRAVAVWSVRILQRAVARMCNLVIVAREDIGTGVLRGIPVVVISNYPSVSLAQEPVPERVDAASDRLTVAYVGSMTPIRGVEEMVRALPHLPEDVCVTFELYGRFSSDEFRDKVLALPTGCGGVRHHGQVPYAEVGARLAGADAGIVCFLPVPNNVNSGPTKLFEYMACGLPVLASGFPEWRKVVESADCGICVDPTDPADIARGLVALARAGKSRVAMGRRGRAAILAGLNWEAEAVRLIEAYRRVLAA